MAASITRHTLCWFSYTKCQRLSAFKNAEQRHKSNAAVASTTLLFSATSLEELARSRDWHRRGYLEAQFPTFRGLCLLDPLCAQSMDDHGF